MKLFSQLFFFCIFLALSAQGFAETDGFLTFGLCNEINEDSLDWSTDRGGLELSLETSAEQGEIFGILAYDCFWNENDSNEHLLGLGFGYALLSFFQPYHCIFLGLREKYTVATRFAYKASAGFRVPIHRVCFKADISYNSLLGAGTTFSVGIGL